MAHCPSYVSAFNFDVYIHSVFRYRLRSLEYWSWLIARFERRLVAVCSWYCHLSVFPRIFDVATRIGAVSEWVIVSFFGFCIGTVRVSVSFLTCASFTFGLTNLYVPYPSFLPCWVQSFFSWVPRSIFLHLVFIYGPLCDRFAFSSLSF